MPDRPVAIVAHDAGGAEILSSFVRRASPGTHLFVLEGPARRIFESKLGPVPLTGLDDAVAGSASLLCGTGWQSSLEVDAIRQARAAGKPSVAFLDHWVNYRERFERNGETVLPDALWVGDPIALDRARAAFPATPVADVGNPYFDEIREQFASRPAPAAAAGLTVLFVGEPVREHALSRHGDPLHWGYTQHQALDYLLDHLDLLGPIAQVVVRPHPAEPAASYAEAVRRHGPRLCLSRESELAADIAASDWVAGCNTMAMVVGLLARRRVLCCIPPGGRPSVLPQPEIVQLQALAGGLA